MAIMYPKNIELYNATLSEKKVFKALQEQLSDKYTVFYSVQWVDNLNGHRKESECDFLIFNEQYGYLTCEVKGGRGLKKVDEKFYLIENDGDRELNRSPMQQSEESCRYFYGLYRKEYNEKFEGIYGSISCFPFYNIDDPVLMDHREKEQIIDANDMLNLDKKIQKCFLYFKNKKNMQTSITKMQRINFKNMINKSIATMATVGSIVEEKEFELSIINRVQDNLIDFIKNYNRTFISGGAGTGKTWIAYKLAKKALQDEKRTLITTMNKSLIEMFKSLLIDYEKLDILSFEDLVLKDGCLYCENSEKLIEEYNNKSYCKYDAIIVDEAQDFDQFQAMIISEHLKCEESELRVFYDLTQNLYDKNFKDGFEIEAKPFLLRENLRNTSCIYDFAKNKTGLGKDVITNQIIGPMPVELNFKKEYELIKYLEDQIVKMIKKDNISTNSITILSDHDNFNILNNKNFGEYVCSNIKNDNGIFLSLVENFKGLESNIIYYVHSSDSTENYNYVAYTRAKYYLFELIMKK